ncbi:group II intron reverse transcriptase/maturase [Pedobacter nutrimenti]|uniref:RNA-directed DNA polymerase n=1 Tax=Pedobacter nutrimenti TaxID=1241337 RepID=A0A318U8W0_9SPHI|nr:group II intron reverse transcriptase/maturase [Pedobacter nutrimenti]PYF68449.1 group II intron reverse transcriptase/maturase [Pedobacter nutrimenti]
MVTLERILDRKNIEKALLQVARNKGAAGVDGMLTEELQKYLNSNWRVLKMELLEGKYCPKAVREVEIPKPNGGTRMLGIPTVIDRMLQQAISQVMIPVYEEQFSACSYGFRPKRNAHQAVLQAQCLLKGGREWVVELDLEKFFDKVNHDRLMSRLSLTIKDKPTLSLIRKFLTSGILKDGVETVRTAGTPQGSPLSPLLSNIVLDELDKEIEKRGHAFIRYADDCSIYLKSERAAKRTASSITRYIEDKLLLKVNKEKTKVSYGEQSTLLGYSFEKSPTQSWMIQIPWTSINRVKRKCKALTKRSNGKSEKRVLENLKVLIEGWINYFQLATANTRALGNLDGYVRVRLRMHQWKAWKRAPARIKGLLRLGASKRDAYEHGHSSKSYCRIAKSWVLTKTMTNKVIKKRGYLGFVDSFYLKKKAQMSMF